MSRRAARAGAVALALVVWLGGCGSGAGEDADGPTLTVYAASSLTGVFTDLGADFEAAHPGVTVEFSFAGSADLAAQIQEGAPADVFASADEATMATLETTGLVTDQPAGFAANVLEIAVPPDNPAGVRGLGDLARPGVFTVVCAPEVPCGAAAVRVTAAAGVTLTPVSEEQKVTDVLAKVATGEADAGLVYVTDVRSAGDTVVGIPIPEASEAMNTYLIAPVADSPHADLARRFIALVRSENGQRALAAAGFRRAP